MLPGYLFSGFAITFNYCWDQAVKKLTDADIKRITDATIRHLGQQASQEQVQSVIKQVTDEIERGAPSVALSAKFIQEPASDKIILTAFGKNGPGILFGITKILYELNCDVYDVSQKIMSDFFTLMMIVDISTSKTDFNLLKTQLTAAADKMGFRLYVQHEEIFKSMHRI